MNKRKVSVKGDGDKTIKKKKRFFNEAARLEEERLTALLFGGNEEILKNLEDGVEQEHTAGCLTPEYDNDTEPDFDKKLRQPAWFDEDDEETTVGLALNTQGRKLPEGGMNDSSVKYSTHLKNKFIAIHGKPKWADLDRKAEEDSDEEILKTAGHLAKPTGKLLAMKSLQFKKVSNLNKETLTEGPVVITRFHPTSSVALVAGTSGIASLFAVDGRTNEKLHSVAYNKYPIKCARFSFDGNEAILGSVHKYFNIYDLMAGKSLQVPLPHGVTHMKQFELSPCGKLIAVAGRFGEVHLLTGSSKELICSLKQGSDSTAFSFSPDSSKLYSHGADSEITVWDVNSRTVCHKFIDDGCVNGSSIAHSNSGQYLATGSAQGAVNIYQTNSILSTTYPKPVKTLLNLRTAITSLEFNSSSEILSMTSSDMDDAIRLVHFPSVTVYDNFPAFEANIGKPMIGTFSPGGGYYAVSNKKSTVFLYRLKHYKNY